MSSLGAAVAGGHSALPSCHALPAFTSLTMFGHLWALFD